MDAYLDGMEMSMGAVFFIGAFSLMAMLFRGYGNFCQEAKASIYDNGLFYEQPSRDGEADREVSYGKVMGLLLADRLDYDVAVNGTVLEKEGYHYFLADISGIQETNFKRTYVRDAKGAILRIDFVSQ